MRRTARLMAVLATAMLAGACGGGDSSGGGGGASAFQAALQGTWSRCNSFGATSVKTSQVISGSAFTSAAHSFTSGDCTGTATLEDGDSGTFTIGAAVTKTVGGASVTAYEVNLNSPVSGLFYTLLYVDTAATPNRLYFGDSTGTNDGSAPALRPSALLEAAFSTKE